MTVKSLCSEAMVGLAVSTTDVRSRITSVTFNFTNMATTCYLTIDHVHVVSDTAYCADPSKNNPQVGKSSAFEKAFDKAFELVVMLEKHDRLKERGIEIPTSDRFFKDDTTVL